VKLRVTADSMRVLASRAKHWTVRRAALLILGTHW
jgi:hypothetical protein